jgi:hypothetical protein
MSSLVRTLAFAAIFACTPVIAESQQAKIPSGTYVMVPDSGFALDVPIASITLVFSDSTMTANMDGQMIIRSRLTQSGDQVTLTDVEGEMACGTPATYKVEVTPKGVRLTPIEDVCEQRSSVLAAVTLVKSMQH